MNWWQSVIVTLINSHCCYLLSYFNLTVTFSALYLTLSKIFYFKEKKIKRCKRNDTCKVNYVYILLICDDYIWYLEGAFFKRRFATLCSLLLSLWTWTIIYKTSYLQNLLLLACPSLLHSDWLKRLFPLIPSPALRRADDRLVFSGVARLLSGKCPAKPKNAVKKDYKTWGKI